MELFGFSNLNICLSVEVIVVDEDESLDVPEEIEMPDLVVSNESYSEQSDEDQEILKD